MGFSPEQRKYASIFHPHLLEAMDRVIKDKRRFVYYTDADTALKMIEGKTLWLRQASLMNDSGEVHWGINCIKHAYDSDEGKRLKTLLNDVFPEITDEIEREFDANLLSLQLDTYVACVSEHGGDTQATQYEDWYGRLSMWRAYGRGVGVALVLKQDVFLSPTNAFGAFTSPVAYMTPDEITVEVGKIATNLENSRDFLAGLGREGAKNAMLVAFRAAAVCTKHPGFIEEREWRVVAIPGLIPPTRLTNMRVTLGRIPQDIYAIPLANVPEAGLTGMELPDLIDRIIIGPTEVPATIYQVLHRAMTAANIPTNRLHVTHIPLRTPPA